jgi:formyl-CoA transferase
LKESAHSPDSLNLHRNKRAMTLDLKSDGGREVLARLVRDTDVLVENMRVPVKHRLGVDFDSLAAINPRIVLASISGFGQTGPYAERGGVDQIAQGLSGLMSVTGLPGQGPVRAGIPVADLAAGLHLAFGILAALHERQRTGVGRWVHTSLLEAMVSMMDFQAARWTVAGEVPEQAGNDHPIYVPMGTFPTSDAYINIAGPGGRMYRNFCTAIGDPDLVDEPNFATIELRSQNRAALNERVAKRLQTKSTAEWVEVLDKVGVPCGPVNSIDKTFADPQVAHLGMAQTMHHDSLGDIDIVRNPINLDGSAAAIRRPSPDPGQHTDEILADLGYDDEDVAKMRKQGVI